MKWKWIPGLLDVVLLTIYKYFVGATGTNTRNTNMRIALMLVVLERGSLSLFSRIMIAVWKILSLASKPLSSVWEVFVCKEFVAYE